VFTLFLLAAIAVMLTHGSAMHANSAGSELEGARADYVAAAALQHALWRTQNNACMGNVTIPNTTLGKDTYSATITGASAGTAYTLSADQDAWIRSDDVSTNNGATVDQHLRLENGKIEQALTRFDLSSLPKDAQILSATAWFYVTPSGAGGGAHPEGPITVHGVTSDWTETGATWQNMNGEFEDSRLASIPAQPVDAVWVSFNLTGKVQAWVNGRPNYGILMAPTAEGTHGKYASREDASNAPRLEVVVGSGAASPVTIEAEGELYNGVKRRMEEALAVAYQPPTSTAFQPGAEGKDGGVRAAQSNDNFGVAIEVTVSGGANPEHFLAQFAVEQVPKGSRIISARLEMYLNWMGSADPAAEFSVHRMTEPWTEGSGDNWNPGDGANWKTSDGSTLWDWQTNHDTATAIDTTVVDPSFSGWHSWDFADLVRQWVSGDVENYGVVIKGNANASKAWFRTSDWSDPSHHPRLIVEYACECGSPCMGAGGSGKILMPASSSYTPNNDELRRIELLESWGYAVEPYWAKNSQNSWTSKMANYDVVYVPATANTGDIGSKLNNAPIGVVYELGALNDDLGMATSSDSPVGSSIDLSDNSHYITAVFPTGPVRLKEYDTRMGAVSGTVAGDAEELATISGTGALVTLEAGSNSTTGTASSRRAFLPVGESNNSLDYLTGAGQLVVQRALTWGMGVGKTLSGKLLLVVGDAGSPASKDADRKTQFETWGYAVTLIDDGADQLEFDTEAAANDVIYVTASINDDTLADKLKDVTVGVISESSGQLDNLGISDAAIAGATYNSFTSTDDSHYITSPFGGGAITHFTQNLTMLNPSTTPASDLHNVAAIGGLTWALASLETGFRRWDNAMSAGRRIHVPFGPANISQLTPDGLTLMQRSIEWAAGAGVKYGLIAHWKLNEGSGVDAEDSVGGHDGTLDFGPAWSSGAMGSAVEFSDDYHAITATYSETLAITGDMTLATWVYANELLPNKVLLHKGTDNQIHNYYLGLHNNQIVFGISPPGGGWNAVNTAATPIVENQWHHIAVSFDDSEDLVVFYVDGVKFSEATETVSPSDFSGAVRIGRNRNSYGWRGKLDDVRIYRDVLDANEVAELAVRKPAAHWKLDDGNGQTAIDSAGGHHGTLLNGPSWTVGAVGDGVEFNGSSHVIEAPHHDDLNITDRLTLAAWINTSDFDWGHVIVHKGTSNLDHVYYMSLNNKNIQFAASPAGGGWNNHGSDPLPMELNQWYHVATTFDNEADTLKFYFNGALVAERTFTTDPAPRDAPVRIGRSVTNDYGWPGKLDDVRIYDRVLDDAEIADLVGRPPIAHWKFDETSGSTAVDSAGGHDGTKTSGSWTPDGMIDGALDFSGTAHVRVPHDDALILNNEFTLSAWATASPATGYHTIINKGTSSNNQDYWFGVWGNWLTLGFYTGGEFQEIEVEMSDWIPSEPTHFAATFDNAADTIKLYKNGALLHTGATVYEPPAGTEDLIIGRSQLSEFWNGMLDDVRIYDRALDDAEISELATAGGGPIAHWKLDEGTGVTAVDSIGGHDGTLINGPVWVAGQLGDALDFDGSNDLVSVPHEAIFTQAPMTVSAWFKLNTLPTTRSEHGTIIDKRHTVDPYASWTLYVNETLGNKIRFQIRDSSETGYWLDSAASAVTNTWYHVVGTIDESYNAKLYVNGALEPDDDNIGSLFSSNDEIRIGAGWSGGNRLDGVVDDVRFYDQALSAAEISGLYTAGTGGGGGGGGGAAPVFEEFTEAAAPNTTTSLNIPKPGGTTAGDLLLAALVTDGDSASSFNPPSGWTQVSVGDNASGNVSLGVWYKIATGSEPSQYSFTWSGREKAYGWTMRFTNHDPSSPVFYDNGTLTNDNTSAPMCQRLITPVDNMLVLRVGGFDDDDITTDDTGLDGHTTITMDESSGTNGSVSGGAGYMIQATAGDTDLAWFQLTNNEQMRTVTLGIRPAP
jgi:hypothetical protein